jgi:hypothetical protein
MTKEQLIDLVVLNLNGGVTTGQSKTKYHPEEVLKYLEIAYDDFILKVCEAAIINHDYSGLDSFTKPYEDIPVLLDTNRNEYYAVMPVPTVQLPQSLAIRQVSPMKAPDMNFRYTQYTQQVVMGNLDVGQIDTNMKYYVENSKDGEFDRIRFWKGFDTQYDKLLVRMVVPFAYLNNKSETSIPANKALAIVAMIKELMGDRKGVTPDLANENSPQS